MLTCSESARNLAVKLNCTISSLKSHSTLWHAHRRYTSDNQHDVLLRRVSRQIGLLIKAAVAKQRELFARHQNVYLYRYHVYIGSTLRAYYIIAVTLGPGGRYTLDGITSMSVAISFSLVNSFIRIHAAVRLREPLVIDRIPPALILRPPTLANLCGRARFYLALILQLNRRE